jgi:chorismate mutase
MIKIRGIRGAVKVAENTKESIITTTKHLLQKMIEKNEVATDDIASIFFTATDDLNTEFPAYAAREIGLGKVPLLCAREIAVTDSMPQLIRILILVNTSKSLLDIKHQYLGETSRLNPHLSNEGENNDHRNEN